MGRSIYKHLEPKLGDRDASIIACGQKEELDEVREDFLKGTLSRSESDEELDAAIKEVCEQMGMSNRTKSVVTFYYLLTEEFGAESFWM